MATIRIMPSDEALTCSDGETLLDALLDAHIPIESPCGGRGTCGKCRIRVVQGASKPSEGDSRHIARSELAAGVRLACMTPAVNGMVIAQLAQAGSSSESSAQADSPTAQASSPKDGNDSILTKGLMPRYRLAPAFLDRGQYGLAIDIGTTTVVVSLIDGHSGAEISSASATNEQRRFGQDVLTRITYERDNPTTGSAELQRVIVDQLNSLIGQACASAGVAQTEVQEVDVAANTTMMHMLLGADARGIGVAPYTPQFTEAQDMPAELVGLDLAKGARLYCLPGVSSFVGPDIVAGAYVCGMGKGDDATLFIDIGTNSEIVLASHGKLLACSCAAGPALEGMNISCGMRAGAGAIENVQIEVDGSIRLTTIGDSAPVGICGSGVLSAIGELLRVGLLKRNGALIKPDNLPEGNDLRQILVNTEDGKRACVLSDDPHIAITQDDIRQVQLAKGAILSGLTALLGAASIGAADLDRVIVAGQFGAHLPVSSLIRCGILPAQVAHCVMYAGNTSKSGALVALMSEPVKREMEALAKRIKYLELSYLDDYDRLLASCMKF